MKPASAPDWVELNAAANGLAEEWLLILSQAETIVRRVALSGRAKIRATPQFESIFEFPKPERLDLMEGFLASRTWRRLEIQWSELLEIGQDYWRHAIPILPNAPAAVLEEAVKEICEGYPQGEAPNVLEIVPLVQEFLKKLGYDASGRSKEIFLPEG
jgi:hypothetical protein